MLELILLAALSADIAPPQMPALPPVCQCGPVCDCGSDCRCADKSVLKPPKCTCAPDNPCRTGGICRYPDGANCPACSLKPGSTYTATECRYVNGKLTCQPAAKSAVYQGQGRARRGFWRVFR